MLKRYTLGFLLIFALALCGCSGTKELSVKQSNDDWEVSDIKLEHLPSDATIEGFTDEGVYYSLTLRDKMKGPEIRSDLAWHFLSFSGEDTMICETDCFYYYDSLINDTNLILNISFWEEDDFVHKVLELSPDGNAEQLAGADADCIYASAGRKLIQQRYRTESQYQEILILLDAAGTETIVHSTARDYDEKNGSGDGEQFVSASLNDQEVIFIVETSENKIVRQSCLYRYDIATAKITDTLPLEQQETYALCAENIDLDMALFPEARVADSVFTGDGFYLTFYLTGSDSPCCHFWNTDTNELYIYTFSETENRVSRHLATKHGVRYLIQNGDEYYMRTLRVTR